MSIRARSCPGVLGLLTLGFAAAAFAQTPPLPSRGPDSSDLFQAIHVVVGPSARTLEPMAVSPFRCPDGAARACATVDQVLQRDLTLSGFFNVLDRASFLGDPAAADPATPRFDDWFNVGARYLVTTQVSLSEGGLDLRFRLWSVSEKRAVPVKVDRFSGLAEPAVRQAVHEFVNSLLEAITGKAGVFGSEIVLALRTGNFVWDLIAMEMDGSGRRTLLHNGSANLFPRFAPGGVLYTSFRSGLPQIYLGDRRITHDERQYRGAEMTRDGRRIVASVDIDGQSDLVLLDARTGQEIRRLTDSPWDEVDPSLSPDGRLVAFCSSRTGRPQVHVIGIDGTGERRLTMAGSYNTAPRFGPNGVIAFSGMDDFVSDLFTVNLSGQLNRLTQQQGSNTNPAWSPDGRWLVFLSDRGGRWRVFLMTEDGRFQYPLTEKGEPWGAPDWR